MNVCFVSDYYSDFIGGGERSLANQMAALKHAGHAVFLIRPHQDHQVIMPNELALKPLFVFRISTSVLPILPQTPLYQKQIKAFLIKHSIDIVHSQGQGGPSYTTLIVARKLGIPYVDTVHTFFWKAVESFGTRVMRPVAPAVMSSLAGYKVTPLPKSCGGSVTERCMRGTTLTFVKKVDVVISPSQHQKDALIHAGLMTPIVCIPNPMHIQHTDPPRRLPQTKPLRLVWIGIMNPEKRLTIFADAIQIVNRRRPGSFEATIIGHGYDLAKSQNITKHMANVRYTGLSERDTVLSVLDRSHLLVLTSYHFDNQPMIVTEAASRHRGVIYCDERLAPEIGGAGIFCRGQDAHSIASTIISCIDNPEKVKRASKHCDSQIQLFKPENYVKNVLAVYKQATKNAVSSKK